MRYSYGGKNLNLNLHFAEFFNLRYATLMLFFAQAWKMENLQHKLDHDKPYYVYDLRIPYSFLCFILYSFGSFGVNESHKNELIGYVQCGL